jgi:hypothetical protein
MVAMSDGAGWRCPLCGAVAPSGPDHLRTEHAIGGAREDRFGLREATRRPSARPAIHRGRPSRQPVETEPPKPAPLPPDAAVLRLICETLEGTDAATLRARLEDLMGVDSVAIDLYDRTVDLYLDRRRATPPHLVTLATERVGLPVVSAELHRAPAAGTKLGPETRLLVLL